MRIALCQTNPVIGDFTSNAHKILEYAQSAAQDGAELAVFPELALSGYPPRDLLDRADFLAHCEASASFVAREAPGGLTLVVGAITGTNSQTGRRLHNSALIIRDGRILRAIHKRLLPTYDVFDEDRHFEPGTTPQIVDVAGTKIAVTICEDIWNDVDGLRSRVYVLNPIEEAIRTGAQLIVNLSASPFTLQKWRGRSAMLANIAKKYAVPLVFVNQVGGNDDLIFDGRSCVYGPDGSTWTRAHAFCEDLIVHDLRPDGPHREHPASDEAVVLDAITLGVSDYVVKCGFKTVVLGLSGGVDSAVTAAIAARALGSDRVHGVAMPTRYSSEGALRDAQDLAVALGIHFQTIPIDSIFESYLTQLTPTLSPVREEEVTLENIQARIRGTTLMALSNRFGHLLLTTGNKSELAVGYCTLYGDMAGGLAVLSDVPKTFVYRLANEINRQAGRSIIPQSTLTKLPSAELRPNQTDQDTLPPYDVLDTILELYIEGNLSAPEIERRGFPGALVQWVTGTVDANEYKRRQMPTGLILTRKAFGPGRRLPIAHRYRG